MLIAGVPLELGAQVQPMLARSLAEQTTEFQSWLGNDTFIEQAARRAWTKICRAIPLSAIAPGLPTLWLEVRPTRAFAAQPRIHPNDVVLMLGIEVETRIIPEQTTPDCPFPARLDVVPQTEQGRISIATPIDIPFTDIDRLLGARLNGKTFPEAGGPFAITVQQVALAASGDRVLVSLHVRARENESWFGLGAEADINLWGRPVLDSKHQVLRFDDIELDVRSNAAFGLLGKAAHAGLPLLQDFLRREAVVDLKPFVADARSHLAGAVHDFSRQEPGVRVDAAIDDLRLVGIAFDSRMLRVTAQASGSVQVKVMSLAF